MNLTEARRLAAKSKREQFERLFAHQCAAMKLAPAVAGLDRYAVSRRLPELQAAGHVRRLAPRVCTINGRPQCTWGAR